MSTINPASAPNEIKQWLATLRPSIDEEIARWLPVPDPDPGRLREAMRYGALGPGKRLRPALVVASCHAAGGTLADALPAAAAVEMLHAYTLVHDDLPSMDDDAIRRGRPTVHVEFGEAIAVLAGDGLLTGAFGALAALGSSAGAAVAVLAKRAGADELLAGQARDLELAAAPAETVSLADLERVHAGKTGALFAASTELGAIAAGADAATRSALARYGMAIGIAFQHADDRDDDEYAALADQAARRMRELCGEAEGIAGQFGAPGEPLLRLARWISGTS